jgi:hypothetical protein
MRFHFVVPAAALAATVAFACGAAAQTAATPPVSPVVAPLPSMPPSPVPSPQVTPAVLTVGRVPIVSISSTQQADAQAYVALARRSLESCGPIGAQPSAVLQQRYTAALHDFTAGRYPSAEAGSQAVIDQCAAAQPQATPATSLP